MTNRSRHKRRGLKPCPVSGAVTNRKCECSLRKYDAAAREISFGKLRFFPKLAYRQAVVRNAPYAPLVTQAPGDVQQA
jgi:hypothetical protein